MTEKLYAEIGCKKLEITSSVVNITIKKLYLTCPLSTLNIFKEWYNITTQFLNSKDFDKSVIVKDITINNKTYKGCVVRSCETVSTENDWCGVNLTYDYINHGLSSSPSIDKKTATNLMQDLFD